ncbi:MAG: MFS transporter [Actinobacteria bacterium]|nr:MFS transporter [Actinomycetota bacterium]
MLISRLKNKYYILFSVSFCKFVFGFFLVSIGSVLVHIGILFNINYRTQSLIFIFNSLGQVVIIFLIGYLSDRIQKKFIHLISLVLISVSCLFFLYINEYYLFLILFFIVSTLASSINFTTDDVISNTFLEKKGIYLNITHIYFGLGALLAPIIFIFLYSKTNNFRMIFLVLALFSIFTLLLILPIRYPERVERTNFSTVLNILKERTFIFVCISLIIIAGTQMTISSWLPTLLQKNLGITQKIANYSLSIFWFAIVIGRILTAYISKKVSIIKLIQIQAGLLFIILMISGFFKSYYLIILYILFGIVTGGSQPLLIALVLTRYKRNSGVRLGLIYSNASLGMLLIPTTVGIFGDYYPFYNVIPFLSIFFLVILYFFWRKLD